LKIWPNLWQKHISSSYVIINIYCLWQIESQGLFWYFLLKSTKQ
jgi:hypothetical protein